MKQVLLTLCTLPLTYSWGRLNGAPHETRLVNVNGTMTNTSVQFTCAGTIRTPQIERTIRNENADVPVALISRIPLQNGVFKFFNAVHVYGVFILATMLLIQFALDKGTFWHVVRGRVVAYAILPWFLTAAWVLQFMAVFKDVDDYWAAPPLIDYRGQVSYIVPFGLHVVVCTFLAFYVFKFDNCNDTILTLLIYVEEFSIVWGLVVGMYVNADMTAGGRANFGVGKLMWDDLVENGVRAPAATPFYSWIGSILLIATLWQLTLDIFTLKILFILRQSKNKLIEWREQHKIGVLMFFAQAAFITGAFVGFFPYCVFGWAEWTCVDNVYMVLPVVVLFEIPVIFYIRWIGSFVHKIVKF